ncbi:M15 family metallopeptidase [Mycobacterium fragae]|uniref:Peptidase M15 n=1 Tax=Mycobacterium fragae TaxID=1260918 RepID=A0A1X1V569_9MYCO|nr:M15 family metallopeptidase [Mycobacterium fragae]MCV7400421.1 M15 family metallopeptidase [Mycobacterium fragae]ORV64246.1 peptidase M15 [Mycobacterium fragae]
MAGALLLACSATPPRPVITPTSPSTSTPAPTVHPITAAELGASWRPGCPVEPEQLRRVDVNHIGFDGQTHRGELIVHKDVAAQVITIFEQLYRLRYPISKIRAVDHYPGAADELSMEDNNTSAFNCRDLPGTNRPSQHSYGRAIDLNPLLNPSIDSTGEFQPKNASAYLDRGRTDPGLLHDGDAAVRVFTDRGWGWGGYWMNPIDYQHFELS